MYRLSLEILIDDRYEVLLDLQDKLQQVIHLYPCALKHLATDHVGDVSPIQGNHGIASAPVESHASRFAREYLNQFTGQDELDYKVAEVLKKYSHAFEPKKDFIDKDEMEL